jgi:hypothetical protein
MIIKILLPNENKIKYEYNILYSKRYVENGKDYSKKIKLWKPLVESLWSKLTESQRLKLIHIHPYDEKIKAINFLSLIKCYSYNYNDNILFNIERRQGSKAINKYNYFLSSETGGRCSCGIYIQYEYIIKNIKSEIYYIIGSECIKWWNVSSKQLNILKQHQINISNKEIKNNLMPIHCSYCYKKNICLDCNTKRNIRAYFIGWKEYLYSIKKEKENIYLQNIWTVLEKKINGILNIKYNEYKIENDPQELMNTIKQFNTDEFLIEKLKKHYDFIKFKLTDCTILNKIKDIINCFNFCSNCGIQIDMQYVNKKCRECYKKK